MNEKLKDAFDNIYDARLPNIWKRGSWESSTLGFWFTELLERDKQFRTWCFEVRKFTTSHRSDHRQFSLFISSFALKGRPTLFWMSGFFNPQGFITAMRQEVTRAHKGWALDTVNIHNEVTRMYPDACNKPPKEGVYVYGLFLDGASWDNKKSLLKESINKVLFTSMPVVHIYAINSTAAKDSRLYVCPVYKKPKRTDLNFFTPLWVKTVERPEH